MLAQTTLAAPTAWIGAAQLHAAAAGDAGPRTLRHLLQPPSDCGTHAFNGAVVGGLLGLVIGPLVVGYGDGHHGHLPSLGVVALSSAGVGGLVGGLLGATARKRCA